MMARGQTTIRIGIGTMLCCAGLATALAADFTVTSTADPGDGVCDADCTLREAMVAAQAAGDDTILFAIPGAGPHTIAPLSFLPSLASGTLLNGYSQPDAVANSAANGSNAVIKILLSGAANPGGTGLSLGGTSIVRGLAIGGFSTGISTPSGSTASVQGCFIGLAPNGSTPVPNGTGINGGSAAGMLIGGPTLADVNVIGSSVGDGVFAGGDDIINNIVGLAADGTTARGNGGNGIDVRLAGATVSGNTIANNVQAGVRLNNTFSTALITGNSIVANGQRGITLGPNNAATANDRDDADVGANSLQNTPVLTLAGRDENTIIVGREFIRAQGFLNSTANTDFRIEIFVNSEADSSGFGEGELFLGDFDVQTDANGFAFFKESFQTLSVEDGQFLSATATNLVTNETSEFSNALVILNEIRVTNAANSGAGSLRQAILDANATVTQDAIVFAIGGAGLHVISPLNGLPALTESVVIDGYTQSDATPNSASGASNTVLRIALDGSGAGNSFGLRLDGEASIVRGLAIHDFRFQGIDTQAGAPNALIEGNFIGLLADGVTAGPIIGSGVQAATTATVGGLLPPSRNVISANASHGIVVNISSKVFGNVIGRSADLLQARGNGGHGVHFQSGNCGTAFAGSIGSTGRDEGNVIASNSGDGVVVSAGSCAISGNAIYGNGGLGIDLGDDGVDSNDANDGDIGPNGHQNFPVITALTEDSASTTVAGNLLRPSLPVGPARFWLEFHGVLACDVSGHGEGEVFLHASEQQIDNDGLFSVTMPFALPPGLTAIVATAATVQTVRPLSTSEYSACFVINRPDDLFFDGFEG